LKKTEKEFYANGKTSSNAELEIAIELNHPHDMFDRMNGQP
jgi:hypothetical protein